MEKYILEASNDNIKWKHMATFEKGQPSRFSKPFTPDIAVEEAKSFKHYRKEYPFVRLIITIE